MALDVFDALFDEVSDFAANRSKTLNVRQMPMGDLPFRVGPGASRGVLLRSETFVELGSAKTASSSLMLATSDPSRLNDGRVRFIGRDISEARRGSTLPFGVVLLVGGRDLTDEDCERLVECQYVTDWIEGYMVRCHPGSIWGRVSRDAAKRGFDLAFLGAALAQIAREKVSRVDVAEVLFVTSTDDDVHALDAIGERCRAITHDLRREIWAEKGIDIDCQYGGHCGACGEKETCDEVRKVAHLREQGKRDAGGSTPRDPASAEISRDGTVI